jgi:hypothetical protein
MFALTGEQDAVHISGQGGKKRIDANHRVVVERIVFVRAVEPQDGDGTLALGEE